MLPLPLPLPLPYKKAYITARRRLSIGLGEMCSMPDELQRRASILGMPRRSASANCINIVPIVLQPTRQVIKLDLVKGE